VKSRNLKKVVKITGNENSEKVESNNIIANQEYNISDIIINPVSPVLYRPIKIGANA
jgi:hypothetical protein